MNSKHANQRKNKSSSSEGRLIAFGGLHLILDLNLLNEDFDGTKDSFSKMNSLKDFGFIAKSRELWNNIMITSNNDTINLLLNANLPFSKKIAVDYVVMSKITYSGEQEEFKNMIMSVMKKNSIKIQENDICNCNISIVLNIYWNDLFKSFPLCNESRHCSKEEKEEEETKKRQEEMRVIEEKEKNKEKEKVKEKERQKEIEKELESERQRQIEREEEEEREKEREKEREQERQRLREIEKEEEGEKQKEREQDKEREEELEKQRQRQKENEEKEREKQKEKEQEQEKEKEKEKEQEKEKEKEQEQEKEKEKEQEQEKEKEKEQDQEKEKEKEQENVEPANNENKVEEKANEPNADEANQKKEEPNEEKKEEPKETNTNNENQDQNIKEGETPVVEDNQPTVEANPPKEEDNPTVPAAEAPPAEDNSKKIKSNYNEEEDKNNPLRKFEVNFESYEYIIINFNDYTKGELGMSVTFKNLLSFLLGLKQTSDVKIMVDFFNSLPSSLTNEDFETFEYILQVVDILFFDKKEAFNLFQTLHNYHGATKSLEKKRYLDVFYNFIACNSLSKSKNKIALFLDEFNKLDMVKTNGTKNQNVTELDASLYPKINHYNHKAVEEYKNLISDNYLKYATLFVGAYAGKLIHGNMDAKTVYSGYLIGIESVKKILELNKNNITYPKNSDFYIVKLPKGKIDQKLGTDMLQTKEKSFVLDCMNESKSKLKYYNPLFDSHLNSFFSNEKYRKDLKTKGFINTKGFIMYDAEYRELLGGSQQKRRGDTIEEYKLVKTINSINVGEHYPNKEMDTKEEARRQTSPLSKKLPIIQPNHTQYQKSLNSKRLPPLRTSGGYTQTSSKRSRGGNFSKAETEKQGFYKKK